MVATFEWKVRWGAAPGTETVGSATKADLMNTDADPDVTNYADYPIPVPDTGTNYSYERWLRGKWSGTFNKIENMRIWRLSGTGAAPNGLSDPELDLAAGSATDYVTPTNALSTIATITLAGWDSEAEAIDITPAAGFITAEGYSEYLVMQLRVPSTVTTPGDIGTQTIRLKYDES